MCHRARGAGLRECSECGSGSVGRLAPYTDYPEEFAQRVGEDVGLVLETRKSLRPPYRLEADLVKSVSCGLVSGSSRVLR